MPEKSSEITPLKLCKCNSFTKNEIKIR